VLSVLETTVGLQRPQKRLLERVVGPLAAEAAAEETEHVGPVLLVEQLERRDRHDLHLREQTVAAADL
jgi:hypothetical protein